MKANVKAKKQRRDDAVSPVIGVILMVAITVVLAATVYVWVSGLSSESKGSENAAVRATMGDADGDGSNDHIKILLVRGDNAPYTYNYPTTTDVQIAGGASGGNFSVHGDAAPAGTAWAVCSGVPTIGTGLCAAQFGATGADQTWDVGQTLYAPCVSANPHSLSVSVKGTAVFEGQMDCEQASSNT